MRARGFAILIAIASVCVYSAHAKHPPDWPIISSIQKSYRFERHEDVYLRLQIPDTSGNPAYELVCLGYEPDLPTDFGRVSFDASGVIHCDLDALYGMKTYSRMFLLASTWIPTKDWETRARFLGGELLGDCADYPEYGSVRTFRLRGLKLVLAMSDVGWAPGRKEPGEFFRFSIAAGPDSTATTSFAEAVSMAEPERTDSSGSRHCSEMQRRHISGDVTEEYSKSAGLLPPYPQVKATEKASRIPSSSSGGGNVLDDSPPVWGDWDFYLPIYGAGETLAYEFVCVSYVVPAETLRIDRHGTSCRLYEDGGDKNLLADSVDPVTQMPRAHVWPEQLEGSCAVYPEWGTVRSFALRGFRLTMEFSDPVFVPGEFHEHAIESVGLTVRVDPDPAASSPVALPSEYADWSYLRPEIGCQRVLKHK